MDIKNADISHVATETGMLEGYEFVAVAEGVLFTNSHE